MMTPFWRRLEPSASELAEVRWYSPARQRPDVLVRRFRREGDAVRFAERLRDRKHVTDVRVWVAPIGRWRELPLSEVDTPADDSWGW